MRRPHRLALLHQVAGPPAEVLGAFEHLAQRSEPRRPARGALARVAQALGRFAQRPARPLVTKGRLAQHVHQPIALGEQVVEPFLEPALLLVHAARLALLHFEGLVGAAQATGDLLDPVPERRDPILGAGDPGERLDEPRVERLALALEAAQRLACLAHLRLGLAERRLLGRQLAFEVREVLGGRTLLGLRGPELGAQARALLLARLAGQRQVLARALLVLDPTLELFDLAAQREERLAARHHGALALGQHEPQPLEVGLALDDPQLGGLGLVAEPAELLLGLGDLHEQLAPMVGRQRELEHLGSGLQPLVARGLARLPLERRDLPPDLCEHVRHAQQVLLGGLELALRLLAPRLVPADPGRLLDQVAPVLGPGRDDRGDLALFDDRVAPRADAGVAEEVVDVAQPAGGLVDQVLGLAAAVEPSRDLDLRIAREGGRGPALGVVEGEHHLGHAGRPAELGAGEDHVLHALAAQAPRGLLAHAPAHRVDHVRLAAAVGTHDAGDARLEAEDGTVGKGLESRDLEGLDSQPGPRPPRRGEALVGSGDAGREGGTD